jgi:hypothetical protein
MHEQAPITHEAACALCGQRIERHGEQEWSNAAILRITVDVGPARGKDPMGNYVGPTADRRAEVRALVCEMCAQGRLGDVAEMQLTASKQVKPQETGL